MNRLPAGRKPWPEVINAILDGSLPVFWVEGDFTAVLIRLAVSSIENLLAVVATEERIETSAALCTRLEAGEVLGISVAMVVALLEDGHIPQPAAPGGSLGRAGVLEVAKRLIFTTEVSVKSNVGVRYVRSRLAKVGVAPAFEMHSSRGLAYLRSEVEPVLHLLRHA